MAWRMSTVGNCMSFAQQTLRPDTTKDVAHVVTHLFGELVVEAANREPHTKKCEIGGARM